MVDYFSQNNEYLYYLPAKWLYNSLLTESNPIADNNKGHTLCTAVNLITFLCRKCGLFDIWIFTHNTSLANFTG